MSLGKILQFDRERSLTPKVGTLFLHRVLEDLHLVKRRELLSTVKCKTVYRHHHTHKMALNVYAFGGCGLLNNLFSD